MKSGFRRPFRVFSQTSLLGTIVRNAQRPAKVSFRLRKERAYSLWRPQFVSGLLSCFCNSALSSTHGALARVRSPGLSSRRPFLAHVFSIVAGLGRVENTQCLVHNGLIPPLLGLSDFPHRDTLRTFLRRFDAAALHSLAAAHDKLRAQLFRRLDVLYSATVDADTTTLLTYGSQEGVARGYIPKRRHSQSSYAPILS